MSKRSTFGGGAAELCCGDRDVAKKARAVFRALLIAGSGPQDRDESPPITGLFVFPMRLPERESPVLRYDKRGVGKSTGNPALPTTDGIWPRTRKRRWPSGKSRKKI